VIERFLEVAQRLRREQAICGGQECWSFGELADRVCAYGEGIGRSRKRPVIYSVLRPGLDQIALLMASMSVPTIYVPIDASISDAEMRERCALLPPDALVCDEDRVEDWEHRRSTVLPEYCRVLPRDSERPASLALWRRPGAWIRCPPRSATRVSRASPTASCAPFSFQPPTSSLRSAKALRSLDTSSEAGSSANSARRTQRSVRS
jgi:acyl-CoA synthetase (AMP-forming)/AMP-acid ligase II